MAQNFKPEAIAKRREYNRKWMAAWYKTSAGKAYQAKNREKQMAANKLWRKNNPDKVNIQKLKQKEIYDVLLEEVRKIKEASPCTDCGRLFPGCAMDFDHRDPATKLFNLGMLRNRFSGPMVFEEIAKCDLVCSNCHRIRTFNKRQHTFKREYSK